MLQQPIDSDETEVNRLSLSFVGVCLASFPILATAAEGMPPAPSRIVASSTTTTTASTTTATFASTSATATADPLANVPSFQDVCVVPEPRSAAEYLCFQASALLARKPSGLGDMDEYEEPRRATHQFATKVSSSQYDEQSALSTKKHVSALIDTISTDPSLYYRTLERRARERAAKPDGSILGFFKATFNTLFANTGDEQQPMLTESCKKAQADGLKIKMFQVYEYGTAGRDQPLRRPQRISPTERQLINEQRYANNARLRKEQIIDCGARLSSGCIPSSGSDGPLMASANLLEVSVNAFRTAPPLSGGAGAAIMPPPPLPLPSSTSAASASASAAHHEENDGDNEGGREALVVDGPTYEAPPPDADAELLLAPKPEEPQQQHAVDEAAAAAARDGRRGSRSSLRALHKRKSAKRLSFEMENADEIDDGARASSAPKQAALKDRNSRRDTGSNGGNAGNVVAPTSKKKMKKAGIVSLSPATALTPNSTATTAADAPARRATKKKKTMHKKAFKGAAGGKMSLGGAKDVVQGKAKLSRGGKTRVKQMASVYGSASTYASAR